MPAVIARSSTASTDRRHLDSKPLRATLMLCLKAYCDDHKVDEIKLSDDVVTVGRSPSCDLVLEDLSVSRKHARIEPHGNFYLIRDAASTNGTYVNDRVVQAELLRPGDAVRIGKFILKLAAAPEQRGDTSKIRIRSLTAGTPPSETRPVDLLAAAGREARERLVRLWDIQRQLGYVDSLPSLVNRALERMLEELEADRGCILLGDFQTTEEVSSPSDLAPSAIASRRPGADDEELVVPEELVQQVIDSKEPSLIRAARRAGETQPEAMAAPFLAQERVLGLVYLERDDRTRPFTDEELQFLTLIASLVAVNLTNTLLFDEIFAEKEKLQAVISNLSEGMLLTDTELRVIEASARAANLLEEEENLLGRGLFELTKGFKLSTSKQVVLKELEQGQSRFQMETQNGERVLAVRIVPFSGPVSSIRGRVVFLTDATESRRIEEKKVEFIRNIAHKIRTPLTLIEGNLPLLHGELRKGSSEESILRDVEKGSSTLCALVDDFVSFMEMEIREVRSLATTQEVNVHELCWEAINAISAAASKKQLMLNNKLPGNLPLARVHPKRFLQAVQKILANAVKFSPQGGIVSIEGERDGDVLRLHVNDEGPGIPPEHHEAVFRVFHQVDKRGTGEEPGYGLGLSIAHQIIHEHGGDIRITSPFRAADHGCRITVVLPLKGVAGATEAKAAKPAPARVE